MSNGSNQSDQIIEGRKGSEEYMERNVTIVKRAKNHYKDPTVLLPLYFFFIVFIEANLDKR